MKFLQTKPHVMSLKNNYFDLYYTVTKNKNDKEIVNDKYENMTRMNVNRILMIILIYRLTILLELKQ